MKFAFIIAVCCVVSGPTLWGQQVTLSSERGDALYIGSSNWLTIVSQKGDCATITVTADVGELKKAEACRYTFDASTPGTVTITLKQKIKSKDSVIATKQFAIKFMPPPEARVGRRKSGLFPLAQFKVQRGISIVQEGLSGKPYFKIRSFEIKIYRNKALIYSGSGNGSYFSDSCKAFLPSLRHGDVVNIDNITCTCPDCRIQKINDLSYIMS